MTKTNHAIYINEDVWTQFKKLVVTHEGGQSISQNLENYMQNYINQHLGKTEETTKETANYEMLKGQHVKLTAESDKLKKQLKKAGILDNLADFAEKIGMDLVNYRNITEKAPLLLEKWQAQGGVAGHAHLFITLLETLREKRQIELSLEEARRKKAEKTKNP